MKLMSLAGQTTRDGEAVEHGRNELRQALDDCPVPERGLEVDMMGRWTPAELAIAADDIGWVSRHIDSVRRHAHSGPDGTEPAHLLHVAAGYASTPMVELLIANGFDVNQRELGNETPLMASVYVGLQTGTRNSEALLKAGADVNAIADNGTTALYFAVLRDNLALVDLLLHHGARVRPAGPAEDSVVAIARRRGRADIIALIQGAEARQTDETHN